MKTVYFVRHGESTENVPNATVFEGGATPLTDRGRAQAEAIAGRARKLPVEVVIASPMVRARDTAAVIAGSTGLQVEFSELFVERKAPTSFTGRLWADQEFKKEFQAWEQTLYVLGSRAADGENFESIRQRASAALAYLEARPEQQILVVTHGFFLRVMLGLVTLGEAFAPQHLERMYQTITTRNTGITVLIRSDESSPWQLLTWNDHAHLG